MCRRVSKNVKALAKLPRLFTDALFGYDFFISYAHADGTEYPNRLSEDLAKLGFQTHLDTRDYHAGADLDRLTEFRLKNSRNLVVICRPMALTQSKWVRREIDAFERRGQSIRLIDVENSVEKAPIVAQAETVAAWLSEPSDPSSDKSRAEGLLRIEDFSDAPDYLTRIPNLEIAEALQRAFTDHRQRAIRLRALIAAFTLFVLLTIGLSVASIFAMSAANKATREALTATLQVSADEAERLATTPDSILALRRVVDDVSRAREGLGYVPASTRRALWRVLNTVRDQRIIKTQTAQISYVGWDPVGKNIVTLERDGGVSAYGMDGTRQEVFAPAGEDSATFSFFETGLFMQRDEEETRAIYRLDGKPLLQYEAGIGGAAGHYLSDITPSATKLLWIGEDACLRVTLLSHLPASVAPLFCADEDQIEFARFVDGNEKVFFTTEHGIVRILDAKTGAVLEKSDRTLVFDTWRIRQDAQALIGFRSDEIIRLNGDLDVVTIRSLDAEEDAEMVGGEVLWEEERVLAISNENEQMMQVFSLALEPAGPPFRFHSTSSLGVATNIGAFLSAGYIDGIIRVISARPHGSQLLVQDPTLEFSEVAYCAGSGRLILGDFDGNIYRLDPQSPSQIQSITLSEGELVEDLECMKNGRWVAVVGGRLFSSQTLDFADVTTIDFSNDTASHLALYGDRIIVASLDKIYLLDQQTLANDAVLRQEDALPIALPGTDYSMIFAIAAHADIDSLVIGVKHSSGEYASLVFVTLNDGQVVRTVVQQADQMEMPEALTYSPNGTRITVAGPMLRLETFDDAGQSIWAVRGADNPHAVSLAYVDDDFFLGGGVFGNISLWSSGGTVVYPNFDVDLTNDFISLASGVATEVFASDSEGTLKRYTFDVNEMEKLAVDVLDRISNPN